MAKDGPYADALGDVMPGVEDDDLDPGGSGGVVLDQAGQVVGISVGMLPEGGGMRSCGEPLLYGQNIQMGGRSIEARLVAPPTLDECDSMDNISFRRLDPGGTFQPLIPPVYSSTQ